MSTIPNKPLFFASPHTNNHHANDKVKGIQYYHQAIVRPQDSQILKRAKIIKHIIVCFDGTHSKVTIHPPHTKVFAKMSKYALPKATKSINMLGESFFTFKALKYIIKRNTRVQKMAIPIQNSQEKAIDYLKEIKDLTITHGLDPNHISHEHMDPLRLSKLIKLNYFHLSLDHIYHGMQTNHLSCLTRAFESKSFKAKVALSTRVLKNSKISSLIHPGGASRIYELNLGDIDAGAFNYIAREAQMFTQLRHLSFTLRISTRAIEEYGEIFERLQSITSLTSLKASFMFAYFKFDAEEFFKHFKLPSNLRSLDLQFHPITFCAATQLHQSKFMNIPREIIKQTHLEHLSFHCTVSEGMPTLYSMLSGMNQAINQGLKSLDLKFKYLIEPNKTIEFNDMKLLFECLSKLQTLEKVRLETDFPNFKNLDSILSFPKMTHLKEFTYKVPHHQDFLELEKKDNFDATKLGCILKFIETSNDSLTSLILDISSPNLNDECLGVMLNSISRMNNLRKFDCGVHGSKLHKDSLDSFEKAVSSFSSLEDSHVEAESQGEIMKENKHNQNFIQKSVDGLFKQVNNLFGSRN